jgi:alpha-mannosidase
MKWHSLAPSGNKSIGGYAEAFDPVAAVKYLDANAAFLRRYRAAGAAQPYSVRGAFGFGWDALDRKTGQPYQGNQKVYPLTEHFHIVAKKQTTAQRQVISSNEEDFFRDFESRYGDQLPTESVTYGNEWELYSASMAETSSRVRRLAEKLRPAELMATLVSFEEPAFLQKRETTRDLAFTSLGLYWEHDWTADGPVPRSQRAAWQERLADEIEDGSISVL